MEEKNNNLKYYNLLKECPAEAKKQIGAGRLKGMSDVNPMFRIMKMTEVFGMCGIGWKYEITKQWNESFSNEIKTYCNINLYVKVDGEWSAAIQGTGGSTFVATEKYGAYVSDENYKMALTDALSVAMKALGMAADVYWEKGRDYETKYSPTDNAKHIKTEETLPNNDDGNAMTNDEIIKNYVAPALAQCSTKEDVKAVYDEYPQLQQDNLFLETIATRVNRMFIQPAKSNARLQEVYKYFFFLQLNQTFNAMLKEKREELEQAA